MNSSVSSTHTPALSRPSFVTRVLSVTPRVAFAVDAAITGVFAVLLAVLPAPLREFLRISDALLHTAVVILAPFVVALVLHCLAGARRTAVSYALVFGNGVWVLASIIVVLGPWFSFSPWGVAFIIGQALLVDVLALWQFAALRRGR